MGYRLLLFVGLQVVLCLNMICVAQDDSIQNTRVPLQLPQQWRFGLQNGISYQWANTSTNQQKLIDEGANADDVDDFYKQFRRGYNFSADVHRIFANIWGIGLRYSLMTSSVEQSIRFEMADGLNIIHTEIVNREYVHFIGASFFIRQQFVKAKALWLNSSVALGYARYRNESETDFSNYYYQTNTLATGNTFGGSWDISLEYFPIPMVSVAIGTGCFLARFNHLSVSNGRVKSTIDLTGDDRKNVSRLDFSIGIRVYLK